MKILEKGKWENPWSMEAECPCKECGAKLLIEEKDVKPVDYHGGYYANCAICESNISISGNLIPLRVKGPVDKKRKYSSSWD